MNHIVTANGVASTLQLTQIDGAFVMSIYCIIIVKNFISKYACWQLYSDSTEFAFQYTIFMTSEVKHDLQNKNI